MLQGICRWSQDHCKFGTEEGLCWIDDQIAQPVQQRLQSFSHAVSTCPLQWAGTALAEHCPAMMSGWTGVALMVTSAEQHFPPHVCTKQSETRARQNLSMSAVPCKDSCLDLQSASIDTCRHPRSPCNHYGNIMVIQVKAQSESRKP